MTVTGGGGDWATGLGGGLRCTGGGAGWLALTGDGGGSAAGAGGGGGGLCLTVMFCQPLGRANVAPLLATAGAVSAETPRGLGPAPSAGVGGALGVAAGLFGGGGGAAAGLGLAGAGVGALAAGAGEGDGEGGPPACAQYCCERGSLRIMPSAVLRL